MPRGVRNPKPEDTQTVDTVTEGVEEVKEVKPVDEVKDGIESEGGQASAQVDEVSSALPVDGAVDAVITEPSSSGDASQPDVPEVVHYVCTKCGKEFWFDDGGTLEDGADVICPGGCKCAICDSLLLDDGTTCSNTDCESNKKPEGVPCEVCSIGRVIDGKCNNTDCQSHKISEDEVDNNQQESTEVKDAGADATSDASIKPVTSEPPVAPKNDKDDEPDTNSETEYQVGDELTSLLSTTRVFDSSVSSNYKRMPLPLFVQDSEIQHNRVRVSDSDGGLYIGWVNLSDVKRV